MCRYRVILIYRPIKHYILWTFHIPTELVPDLERALREVALQPQIIGCWAQLDAWRLERLVQGPYHSSLHSLHCWLARVALDYLPGSVAVEVVFLL